LSRPLPGLKAAHLLDPGTLTGADNLLWLNGFSTSIEPSRPQAKRDKHEDPAE
jgi:hypothetical protein